MRVKQSAKKAASKNLMPEILPAADITIPDPALPRQIPGDAAQPPLHDRMLRSSPMLSCPECNTIRILTEQRWDFLRVYRCRECGFRWEEVANG